VPAGTRDLAFPSIRTIMANAPWTKLPDVCGRVVSKSRIVHFGKRSQAHKYPFSCDVVLMDGSERIRVTLWNEVARDHYQSIVLNDVLVITGAKSQVYVTRCLAGCRSPSHPTGCCSLLVVCVLCMQ
jgi:hypothetical protein